MEPDPWLILDSGTKPPLCVVILRKCFRDLGAGAVGCDGYGELKVMVWSLTFEAGRRRR